MAFQKNQVMRNASSSASSEWTWTQICEQSDYVFVTTIVSRGQIFRRLPCISAGSHGRRIAFSGRFLSESEGSIYGLATPCSSLIPPRNNRATRSCWTCYLSRVTFAPQAADLRCCGRRKCPVGRELIPSAKSDAFFSRSACVKPQLFLLCSSSFLWRHWHRVHRSTPALPLSKACSPAPSQRLRVWWQS